MFYRIMAMLCTILCTLLMLSVVVSSSLSKSKKPRPWITGEFAKLGQFPYTVGLRSKTTPPPCGGTLISSRHILAEAWCINWISVFTVVVGCLEMNSPFCMEYEVSHIEIHPDFTGVVGTNDIAIIFVTKDIKMSKIVQPITISAQFIDKKTPATLSGWKPKLKWSSVDIVEPFYCWNNMTICTSPGISAGKGNYGCPLVVDGAVVGITVSSGEFDVHMRLSEYIDWILEVTG